MKIRRIWPYLTSRLFLHPLRGYIYPVVMLHSVEMQTEYWNRICCVNYLWCYMYLIQCIEGDTIWDVKESLIPCQNAVNSGALEGWGFVQLIFKWCSQENAQFHINNNKNLIELTRLSIFYWRKILKIRFSYTWRGIHKNVDIKFSAHDAFLE
jgi:hypothetical protein